MNLTEIRNKVKAITDYSPELTVYNEQLDLFINDAYNALWTEKRWRFAMKHMFIDIWPDINSTQPDGTSVTAALINNNRTVIFSGDVWSLERPYIWEGQIFTTNGRDYVIDQVISTQQIRLKDPVRISTTTLATTDWKLKHRFYSIPQDALEILYLGHRDTPATGKQPPYGAVRGMPMRREEDLNLKEDWTSFYSICYVPVGVTNIPPGEKLLAVTGETGSGDLDPGYYELCWAFEGDGGYVGALSEPYIIQAVGEGPSSTSIIVAFRTWDDEPVAAPAYNGLVDQNKNQFEGLRKRIYFNQNFNRTTGERLPGLPVWREVVLGSTRSTPGTQGITTSTDPVRVIDTSATYTISGSDQINSGNARYVEWDGQHFRIRPYPRPIGSDFTYLHVAGVAEPVVINNAPERLFRQWELRYYYKPKRLSLQTDTPEMPYEFHQLIVYKALEDIFSKHDNMNQAQIYTKKYEKELERLENRYVDSVDTDYIRQQFGAQGRIWTPFDPNSLRRLN